MSDNKKPIRSPLENAALLGKLGSKTQNNEKKEEKNLSNKTSNSQSFETPNSQTVKNLNSQTVKKSLSATANPLEQQTVYLPKDLRKWLKVQAAIEDTDVSGLVTDVLLKYQARKITK
jgi:hypothetical protein